MTSFVRLTSAGLGKANPKPIMKKQSPGVLQVTFGYVDDQVILLLNGEVVWNTGRRGGDGDLHERIDLSASLLVGMNYLDVLGVNLIEKGRFTGIVYNGVQPEQKWNYPLSNGGGLPSAGRCAGVFA